MAQTESLFKQEFYAMHLYISLAVPVQTSVGDFQCQMLVASA